MLNSTSCGQKEGAPLPANLPHIAYVLLWYPLFTQPFIFREVEELRKKLPLAIYTLYGTNLRHCSQEMRNMAAKPRSYGTKALGEVVLETVKAAIRQPRTMWRLFRGCLLRKWPDLETFGENLWAFWTGAALARRFREDGIDMVYAPWPRGAATAAWVGATLAGLPFAIAARGDNLAPADPDLGDKFACSAFIRANNAADQLRIEDFDRKQAAGKTVLLYNSLTLKQCNPRSCILRLANKKLRILALGRFDVTKGFDTLLRSCGILKNRGVNFELTLAGGGGRIMGLGDLEKSLLQLRHDLDLENYVTMPGLVSHDELPDILNSHDIFVAPCVIDPSGRRDGIPNTVIEAMAYGLPVVSTNVNALPEIVRNGDTGLTVDPNNPDALAEAIIWMRDNPAKARQMGANAAALAAEIFDPSKNAAIFAGIFAEEYDAWEKKQAAGDC